MYKFISIFLFGFISALILCVSVGWIKKEQITQYIKKLKQDGQNNNIDTTQSIEDIKPKLLKRIINKLKKK